MDGVLATYVAAILVVVASFVLGRAFLQLFGRTETWWFESSVGLAILIIVCSVATRAPGRTTTALIAMGVLLIAAIAYTRLRFVDRPSFAMAMPIALIILALGSIPFIASGHFGILGIGVQNDLASHLLWSDFLQNPTGEAPTGVRIGYPLGPHGLAASLADLLGTQPLYGFLGLILATLVITGLTALNILHGLSPVQRTIGAVLVAVPYLSASTVGVAGFKELLVGVFLLCFVLILRDISRGETTVGRNALIFALAVLAAGMVATFSLPGVAWPAATLGIWALVELIRAARDGRLGQIKDGLVEVRLALLVLAVLFVVLVISEIPRIVDFFDSGAVDTITNADSKLRFALSPAELLGAWPSGEFLLGTSGVESWQLFAALGLVAFVFACVYWVRRGEVALPSSMVAVGIVYLGTLAIAGLYVQSKALLIPTALVMLFILGALLSADGWRWKLLIAIPFVAVAGYSSFLALRDSVVAPGDRFDELESLRPAVQGANVLALTSDRYSDYYLRGSELRSPAKNAEEQVENRPDKEFRLPVDFDSVLPIHLDSFDYAVTTNAEYQSEAPPNFKPVEETESYTLWKRSGPTPEFGVLAEEARPGRVFRCKNPKFSQELATEGFTTIWPRPVIAKRLYWKIDGEFDPTPAPGTARDRADAQPGLEKGQSGTTTLEPGESASQSITLPPGEWDLSFQYVSPIVPVTVTAPGLEVEMSPGMEAAIPFKVDEGPFWNVGKVTATGEPIEITITAGELDGLQKLLGVDAPASLGNVTATRKSNITTAPIAASCQRYVDHYTVGTPQRPALIQDTGAATISRNTAQGSGKKK